MTRPQPTSARPGPRPIGVCRVSLGRSLLAAIVGLSALSAAWADPPAPAAVDTTDWLCTLCTYNYGWLRQLDAGLGNVSADSFKFGQYNGLEKSGPFWLLGGDVTYRSKDGQYFDLTGKNLGIASRDLSVDGGTQGEYAWYAELQEIPHFVAADGRTTFSGLGTSSLTLPKDWVTGGSTPQMTGLQQASQGVDIQDARHIASTGLKLTPPKSNWEYSADFQRDTQSGNQVLGGSFLTTTTLLPAPINYRTDQMHAAADYRDGGWQVGFGFYGSYFRDANAALVWENPFAALTPGATEGQLAGAPDNDFNAVTFSSAWQVFSNTRLMASASVGRGTQDAPFLAASLNGSLSTEQLPRTNLGGEVDTLNYSLRGYSSPLSNLDLTLDYSVDRRDNHTPQAIYQEVITDNYVAGDVTNIPYSFSRERADLIADYRVYSRIHLEAGASHEGDDRTFGDAATTRTDAIWTSIRGDLTSSLSASLKADHERRVSPDYTPVDYLFATQNPLLRQLDLADRTRDQTTGQITFSPSANWSAGLSAEDDDDRYDGTSIGLTQSKNIDYTIELGYAAAEGTSVESYFTQQSTAWRQAGSQSFTDPDWQAERDDDIQTVGISAKLPDLYLGLDGGIDLSYSFSRGATAVTTGGSGVAFPDISMRMQHLSVFAKYRINSKLAFRVDYQIERYVSTDWTLDGLSQDTVSNLLALGLGSPNYVVNVLSVTLEYGF